MLCMESPLAPVNSSLPPSAPTAASGRRRLDDFERGLDLSLRHGVRIVDLEDLARTLLDGPRVLDRSVGAMGWSKIARWFGSECLPHDCVSVGAAPLGGVTVVLNEGAAIDAATQREVKAAVWDNVKVLTGPEAGRVGKVTAFHPGPSGDGADDTYVVESLMEGKLDARLLDVSTLGWEAANWPANFVAAKAADKAEQKAKNLSPYDFPTIDARHVRLELHASDFERYSDFLSIDDVVKLVILPRCAHDGGAGRSYCDLLRDRGIALTTATHFPSWAMKYDFHTVVETLREFVDRAASPLDAERDFRFWFSPMNMNQWAAATDSLELDWSEVFRSTIQTIGHTLPIMMPWRAPINLTRAWCVYEIFESVNARVEATFLLPRREREDMLRTMVGEFSTLAKVIAGVALEDAECSKSKDLDRIMTQANAYGMSEINGVVCAALRQWLAGEGRAELERLEEEWDGGGGGGGGEEARLRFALAFAALLKSQSNEDEEKEVLVRTLSRCETALGEMHEVTLSAVAALGMAKADLELLRRALAGREETLGSLHANTLTSVSCLGKVLDDQGKLTEAEPLYQRALKGREETLGLKHRDTLVSVNNLGELLVKQGLLDAAEPLYQRALKGREETLGLKHRDTLMSINNLGALREKQSKVAEQPEKRGLLDETVKLYRQALDGRKATLGGKHRDTLISHTVLIRSFVALATLLRDQNRIKEAKEMWTLALKGQEETLGLKHPDILLSIQNLAPLIQVDDTYGAAAAEPYYIRLLEGFKETLGENHKDTLKATLDLGFALFRQKKFVEAQQYIDRGFEGSRIAIAECKAEGRPALLLQDIVSELKVVQKMNLQALERSSR